MSESEARSAIVAEAISWVGTPYHSNAMVKGKVGGGTDCVMLLVAVYRELGLIPPEVDPRPYPPEWHIHQHEDLYMTGILKYSREVRGPPDREPKPGDLVMFQVGRLFAHGAIVIAWPNVVHARSGSVVQFEDISKNTIGKRALWLLPKRFFSIWAEI